MSRQRGGGGGSFACLSVFADEVTGLESLHTAQACLGNRSGPVCGV